MEKLAESIPILVAVAIAARKTGDLLLAEVALRELCEAHGVTLIFASDIRKSERPRTLEAVSHAS